MSSSTLVTSTSSVPTSTNVIVGGPTCDPNSINSVLPAPQSVLDQGPTCYFNWPDRSVNWTSCCKPGAEIMYTGVCTQYCVVPDDSTSTSFGNCIWRLQPANQTKSIIACKKKGAAGRATEPNAKMAVGLVVLVASYMFLGA